jgi:integration host factor subunit beta
VAKEQSTVTKSELIDSVAAKRRVPRGRAELIVNAIFDAMVDVLKRSEGIEIRGFGTFTIREYKSYEGRNPRTGTRVFVAPKRLPFFKVGKELRERVDAGRHEVRLAATGNESPGAPAVSGRAPPVGGGTTSAGGS